MTSLHRVVGDILALRGELSELLAERDQLIRAALTEGTAYATLTTITGLSRGQLDTIRRGQRHRKGGVTHVTPLPVSPAPESPLRNDSSAPHPAGQGRDGGLTNRGRGWLC